MATITVSNIQIGQGQPLCLIAGPCVIEEEDRVYRIAAALQAICATQATPLIFKASFDKANRTSLYSYRGPGLDEGLRILEGVKKRFEIPITTDIHLPEQAAAVAEVADLIQIPAFLCRQTDLLIAAAATGRPVNVKKGQFLAPRAMAPVIEKLEDARGVMLTERGTSFGHEDLVVDFRGLVQMRSLEVPVCFDCTHSLQQPGALGNRTGGLRRFTMPLARAAVATGIDALFAEVHDDPASARSDAETQLSLTDLPQLLTQVLPLHDPLRED